MLHRIPLKRTWGSRKPYDQVIKTVCGDCSLGCGLTVYVEKGHIVDIHGDESSPVNSGRVCAKGIGFVQGLTSPERLQYPEYRKSLGNPFETLPAWDAGFDILTETLRKINARYGPKSLVIACDPESGFDFFVGAVRFAHLWGTPYVFHPGIRPKDLYGVSEYACPKRAESDWVNCGCIVLVEADVAATHPVAFRWILEAKERGAKIIAADSRFTATMSHADYSLIIAPGSGNILGLALMKILIDTGLIKPDQACAAIDKFDQWRSSFQTLSIDGLKDSVKVDAGTAAQIAAVLGACAPVALITGRRLAKQPASGIWLTMAKAMGWIDRAGWYPMDSSVPRINAYAGIDDLESDRNLNHDADHQTVIQQIQDAMSEPEPQIRAMICSGNCLNEFMSDIREVVSKMDIVVHFGAFPSVTRESSHLSFPASHWAEQRRLCFHHDGTETWADKILEPSEGRRSGLDFWMGLAKRFGDVKRLAWEQYFNWKQENGRADHAAFYQWILDNKLASLKMSDIPPFFAPASISVETPKPDDFPLLFQRTRIASRTKGPHRWSPWTEELERENDIYIHPDTARERHIENGNDVVVASRSGLIPGKAVLTRIVPETLIWSPRRMGDHQVNVFRKGD